MAPFWWVPQPRKEWAMSTVPAVVTGYITANLPFLDAIDHAGIFGPAGARLVGDAFTVNWTGNVDCSPDHCTGGSLYGTPTRADDAVRPINGHSYDLGNGMYSTVRLPAP